MNREIIFNSIRNDGFVVLRKIEHDRIDAWKETIRCPSGDVNYTLIKPLVESSVGRLNDITGWRSVFAKYRASAGCTDLSSNSTDAAAFHRDIHSNEEKTPPLYTLVLYFDNAELSVIPGSHAMLDMGILDFISKHRQNLLFDAGDGVLFSNSLLHRGVFTRKGISRRCVQIFDISPSQEMANVWYPRIAHLQHQGTDLGKFASKIAYIPFISRCLHLFQEVSQAKRMGFDLPNGYSIISSEAWRKRLHPDGEYDGKFHKGNLYVIRNAPETDPVLNGRLRKHLQTRFVYDFRYVGLVTVAISILIVVLICVTC